MSFNRYDPVGSSALYLLRIIPLLMFLLPLSAVFYFGFYIIFGSLIATMLLTIDIVKKACLSNNCGGFELCTFFMISTGILPFVVLICLLPYFVFLAFYGFLITFAQGINCGVGPTMTQMA
jgi:hypothetical protein